MRTLGFSLFVALMIGGCATTPAIPPMTAADVVARSKQGVAPREIIAELQRTHTVLPLRASDYVALSNEGVQKEVLDYLQLVQIEEIRWRERMLYGGWGWYGPGGPCPWGYRYRWGC
jgi:hypothetical protein